MNDYHFKVAKVQGEFVWHDHPETDEVFLVLKGQLEIHFRDGKRGVERRRNVCCAERCGT